MKKFVRIWELLKINHGKLANKKTWRSLRRKRRQFLASQGEKFFIDGKYPFFRTSDVGSVHVGKIEKSVDSLNEAGIKGMKLFKKGTLLFPKSGASTFLNHRVIMGVDGYVSSHLATIKADEKILSDSFLFYFLQEIKAQDLIQDHKYPSLNLPVIKEIEIPLPPLSEQKRIIGVLDGVFEGIGKAKGNAEKNLKNSRELFEAYLEGVLVPPSPKATARRGSPGKNWQEKRMDEVCEIASKLIDPREKRYRNLVHVGAGNIETKTGVLLDLKTAQEEKLISGKFLFDERMVLYSKIRPYLIKVARPNFKGMCSADMYPLLPNQKLMTRDFLYYILLSSGFTKYAIQGSARAGMPKVNREHLFAYSFPFPPLSQQKTIVKKLDTLSVETKKLESIYRQKIADLEELKKSVLKEAFAGRL